MITREETGKLTRLQRNGAEYPSEKDGGAPHSDAYRD